MNRETYNALPAVNWSTLQEATKSALAYKYGLANAKPETDPMRLGRATHTAVFEPELYAVEYVVWEGGDRRGNVWKDFDANAHERGVTVLLPTQNASALAIAEAVRVHPVAGPLLAEAGQCEHTITWTDRDTGLPCKARLDKLCSALVDLKTCPSIDAKTFGRHGADLLYHCKMAFYWRGCVANGIDVPVKIVAVEATPPHDVAVFDLDENVLWAGEIRVQQALNLVADCRKSGVWPGRYTCEVPFMLPSWEFPSDEEEEALIRGEA